VALAGLVDVDRHARSLQHAGELHLLVLYLENAVITSRGAVSSTSGGGVLGGPGLLGFGHGTIKCAPRWGVE
jgi:hypothetical protein